MSRAGFVLFLQIAGGSIAMLAAAFLLLRFLGVDHLIASSADDWIKVALAPVVVTAILVLAALAKK